MSESNRYRLRYVIHEPSEGTEGLYLAEALDIPGCRAWGETQEQAREYLRDVAAGFIEMSLVRGEHLSIGVEAADTPGLVVVVRDTRN